MSTQVQKEQGSSEVSAGEAGLKRLIAQLLLAQRMECMSHLAAAVAHDLNNLLTGIGGFAELALRSLPPGHAACADLQEILRASERATMLNTQLRSLARKQRVEPRTLVLNDLVAAMDEQLRWILGGAIELVWLPAADLGAIKADPGQIEQIIVNLVMNARDAMPEGGVLTLTTANVTLSDSSTPGDYMLLTIKDTGTGMDAEVQAHIFEPFFTTKSSGAAKGLGLFAVRELVHHYGGIVEVASELGGGTTFSMYLPRAIETEIG